ncbi:MAG: choline dehydrogenase [Bacteroidetes bacterium]|nr:choline dehydrogenase [Bacteroidota bacterium]MCY4205401.1 choline dehydrogenase [Bacteroidota bacterium]
MAHVESFDYVIVGAGAAGCVVAHRLAEDPDVRVLLLEAGPPDKSPLIHMPAGFAKLTGKNVNWCFKTVPQKHLNGREMHYPQGRTLGGSTSINAMIYIRGHRLDYEEWLALGCHGWGYEDVLPYFKKSENNERFVDEYHGQGGPLNVADQIQSNPLTRAFVRSAQEIGIRYNPDLNGAQQSGVSYYQVTQRNVRRESTATAFLRPRKPNLTIRTRAVATRILLHNGRATGIEYVKDRAKIQVSAEREVILSGGAVNSPKLLLLSGIGPVDELTPLGIQAQHELPGVGKNFQDHMDVYLAAESREPVSYNGHDRWNRAILHGIQYLLYKTGPVTASVCEAGCFLKSTPEVRSPDIQIHCLPAYVVDHGRMKIKGHGLTINTCNLRPRSIGSVTLQSNDPFDDPAIDPNFLDDPYDLNVSMEAFKWGRRILSAPSFQKYIAHEILPGPDTQSDEEIRAYIRKWSKNDYHPVGSCKMGTDNQSVVDLQLSVRGIESLRVIDASIMPCLISGNTQATSIMIGEKGAAMIKGEI